MGKSLCKYRRTEIADQFAKISKIVSEPKFMCSSCARVASDKVYLCHPSSLSSHTEPTISSGMKLAPIPENIHHFPSPAAVGQSHAEIITVVEQQPMIEQQLLSLEQVTKLEKLTKKKNKQLKKAVKAAKKFKKKLKKAKYALGA